MGLGQLTGVKQAMENATDGVDADVLDRGDLLLEELAGTAHGSAGAQSGHEVVDASTRLLEDLAAGGVVVGLDVVGVVVLVRVERAELSDDAFCRFVVAIGVVGWDVGGTDVDFSAECLERVDFLGAHLVGDGEDAPIALERGCHGKTHTGVARGILDHHAAGLQPSLFFGLFKDVQGHPILDRAARVHELGFDQDGRILGANEATQADERSSADGLEDVLDVLQGLLPCGRTHPPNKLAMRQPEGLQKKGQGPRAFPGLRGSGPLLLDVIPC